MMAVVALMSGGVFSAFNYVFAFFFEIEPATKVLADNFHFASWSSPCVPREGYRSKKT
jgi:hypothetical protein